MNSLELRNLTLSKIAKSGSASIVCYDNDIKTLKKLLPHLKDRKALIVSAFMNIDVRYAEMPEVDSVRIISPYNSDNDKEHHSSLGILPDYDFYDYEETLSEIEDENRELGLTNLKFILQEIDQKLSEKSKRIDNSLEVALVDFAVNRLHAERLDVFYKNLYRRMAIGGRCIFLVYLSDEKPERDIELPNICLKRIPFETEFLAELERNKFYACNIEFRAETPVFITDRGVEVRLYVISCYKGKEGPCVDYGHAVIFKGPWLTASDDDGHVYRRGVRTAVCEKTYGILTKPPYSPYFIGVPCYLSKDKIQHREFDCNTPAIRSPQVTKGLQMLDDGKDCCFPGASNCC